MTKPLHFACVFGTRPEAIKMAPLVRRLRDTAGIRTSVITTGQHREMLDQVLQFFHITPDIRLDAMQAGQSISKLMSRLLADLDVALGSLEPSVVLVHGDTMTTLAAAMSSFYGGFPVAHVEAGLRTSNLLSPWPEESNRRLTSVLTRFHFAPTEQAKAALLAEGHAPDQIWVTGNTVIDALLLAVQQVRKNPPEIPGWPQADVALDGRQMVLITGHRRENFGDGLDSICRAIAELARRFPEARFVYPVHLNPNVRQPVGQILAGAGRDNIHLIEPLPYLPFVRLMDRSTLILTDSGGVQEEAPSLGKPVLVMREETERAEAIEAGVARLVGTDSGRIVAEVSRLLSDANARSQMARSVNPYGDGKASERIIEACVKTLRCPRGADCDC